MPRETDRNRLDLLARALISAPPDVFGEVWFEERAHTGSAAEPDDIGLNGVFSEKVSRVEKERRLREALADHIREGSKVTRVEVAGDIKWGKDPELRYEFRLKLRDRRVYVKIVLDLDADREPVIFVKKVGRWN